MTPNITHTPGTVHDDGEPMTPDEARCKAAALIVAADEAERKQSDLEFSCRVAEAFRKLQHAGELMAHDSGRDQREEQI